MASRSFWTGTVAAMGAALVSLAVFLAAGAGTAEAAFPGENGRIFYAYSNVVDYDPVPEFPVTDAPDVWATDPDGTDRTNLTSTPELYEGAPASSPDGTRVAFVRADRENGAGDVWAMGPDGTGQEKLTDTPRLYERDPAFSPGGRQIAFARYDPETSYEDVWVMRADGTDQRNLTNTPRAGEGEPVFSPDGEKIAFRSGGDVWAMGTNGTARENLTGPHREDGFDGASSPSWSPDGKSIAFHANVSKDGCTYRNVFTMDSGGSAWAQLTRNEDHHDCDSSSFSNSSGASAFSPDGTRIAFVNGAYSERLAVMNRDGSGGTGRLVLDARPDDDYPYFAYSPDWQPVCPCPEVPDPKDVTDPAVTRPRPAPGSEVRDRTPTVRAVVRDETSALAKSDIELRVDGRTKSFSYDPQTDRLSRATKKLAYGRHTVEVEATDGSGNTATERWSFRVVRR